MNIGQLLESFFASDGGQLAVLILILPVADWVSGVAAAIRDGTFTLDAVYAVGRKHFARVFGIWTLLIVGYVIDSFIIPVVDIPAISAIATGAAGLYALETVGSIARSWGPTTGPALLQRDPVQPVPQD
jgi:hypothetical protein